jgi:hypothetical protein
MAKSTNIIILIFLFSPITATQKKIALVKQTTSYLLYVAPPNSTGKDVVLSALKASGPAALFTHLGTHFYIVENEPDQECQTWQEKVSDCHHLTLAFFESLKDIISPWGKTAGHTKPQGAFAVKCDSIDWGQYDIVISMDIAIPKRITQQYPHTLWAYYIGEGCMLSYNKSFTKPIDGYDLFLTQDYHEHRPLAKHVIEFPYQLNYYGCFHELLGYQINSLREKSINLEFHTDNSITAAQRERLTTLMPITRSSGSIKNVLSGLMETKYYVIYLNKNSGKRSSIRGNAIAEAIATGNLVIAVNQGLNNTSLLSLGKTLVNSFEEIIKQLMYFENNPEEFQKELALQRDKLNEFCFNRPIRELFAKHAEKIRRTTAAF